MAPRTKASIEIDVKGLKAVNDLLSKLNSIDTKVNKINKLAGPRGREDQLSDQQKIETQINRLQTRSVRLRTQLVGLNEKDKKIQTIKARLTRAENKAAVGKFTAANRELAIAERELATQKLTTAELQKQAKFAPSSALNFSKSGRLLQGPAGSSQNTGANLMRRFGPTRGFDFQSAAISGAFPLLFGQGPIASLAGGLGGGVGGMFGGMGGFAGGIAATAAVQSIQNAVNAVSQLGQALNPLTADLDALVTSLGFTGTAEAERIKLIEQAQGKQAALNAVTAQMNQVLGADAVESLKRFGETSRLIGNNFSQALLKLQGALAPVLETIANFVSKTTGAEQSEIDRLSKSRIGTDPEAVAIQRRIAELQARPGASRSGAIQGQINNLKAELEARKKILAEQKKEDILSSNKNKKLDIALDKIEKENKLFNATLDGRKEEFLIEQQIDEILKSMDLTEQQINDTQKDRIRNAVKNNVELKKQVDLAKQVKDAFESLSKSINNDIKEGIKGLIKGTSTLGDLLNNVADRFLDVALNQALFGSILGSGGEKGGGILGAIGLFANGGRPPVGRPSIVGEKGPELFVPSSSGTIVPNNKLGGGGSTSVVVNVDASGSDVQGDDAGAKELGTLISVAVQGELLKQQRPGGLLSSLR